MINFILNNPFVSLLSVVVIISLTLILVLTKKAKSNGGKSDKKVKGKPKVEQAIKTNRPIFFVSDTELVDGNDPTVSFLKKKRPIKKPSRKKIKKRKMEYTFISFKKRCEMKWYTREKEEKDLMERMEFVSSSKKVSKLATRGKMLEIPKPKQEEVEPIVEEIPEEHIPTAEEIRQARFSKYFNKDRRLSNYVNIDDPDKMFESHISDVYMDIDSSRHLRIDNDFTKRLYDRAAKVLAHGEIKITDDNELMVKANRKNWIKQKSKEEYKNIMSYDDIVSRDFLDEELDLDEQLNEYIDENYNDILEGTEINANINLEPKNILTVDSILHRKDGYKRDKK